MDDVSVAHSTKSISDHDDTRLLDSLVERRRKKKWRTKALLTVIVLAVSVVLLGTGFVAGLFAGRAIYGDSGDQSSSRPVPDWGAFVTVSGKNESVTEWLDGELQPVNIKNNLRYYC